MRLKNLLLGTLMLLASSVSIANECFIGEVRLFAGNFAPRSWALAQGQLLPISQNSALFSIVGTMYGGDGRTTFGLPDLRGRVPVGVGSGPGLTQRREGQKFGSETNSISVSNMPAHTHTLNGTVENADSPSPTNRLLSAKSRTNTYSSEPLPDTALASQSIGSTGGNQPINNMQPSLGLNYIICLQGIYPSRN